MKFRALTHEEAAAEQLKRNRCRASLVAFAQSIDIPTVPLVEDPDDPMYDIDGARVDEHLMQPIGTGVAALHVLLMNKLQACMEMAYGRLMIFMPPGSAKALHVDTPIPTPDGWTTMGDLSVGDWVFGGDGKFCNVTWVSDVFKQRPVYNVVTDCGDVITADRDHEWLVRLSGNPRKTLKANGLGRPPRSDRDDPMSQFKIKETWELCRRRSKRPMILRAKAFELPELDLPIDPYTLGVWLGDGSKAGIRITCSLEDQKFIRVEIPYETSDQSEPLNFGVLGIRDKFVELKLLDDKWHGQFGRKYIPGMYLRSGFDQRLALLQGLIDSDGTVCKRRGSTTFCNTNRELALQVRELVRTMGVKAGWSETPAVCNGKICGTSYKVSFYLQDSARLPRKRKFTRNQVRTPNTYIDTFEAGVADTVCIEVDSADHMFLCGRSMTPTHNSTYGTVIAPTWIMGKIPGTQIILGSYNTALAKKHGARGRNVVQQDIYMGAFGCTISADTQAKELWTLTNGSEYMSGGLQSGLTGNRADGLIIDDPVRGRADAKSETVQVKTIEAYEDDAQSRLKPGAWQILIQTRWDLSDLAGMILPVDYAGESGPILCRDGMVWEVINLPAKAIYADDPLGRQIGEYLWPEWFDAKHWYIFEPRPGDANSPSQTRWDSLFQQKPQPSIGNEWDPEFTQWYEPGTEPKYLMKFSSSDYAVTDVKDSDDPDFTEHGIAGLDENGHLWLVDWYYSQRTTNYTIAALIALCKKHNVRNGFGESGIIRRAIESQFDTQQREADYYLSIEYFPHIGDKIAKFAEAKAMGSAGKVHIPDTPWGHRLHNALTKFPSTQFKDDGPDVLSLFCRAAKDMIWSREKVTKPKKKGLVFGSWEWLVFNEDKKQKEVSKWK